MLVNENTVVHCLFMLVHSALSNVKKVMVILYTHSIVYNPHSFSYDSDILYTRDDGFMTFRCMHTHLSLFLSGMFQHVFRKFDSMESAGTISRGHTTFLT